MESEMVLDRMDDEVESEISSNLVQMELGDSYSNEDEERVLSAYERLHNRAYKRSSEPIEKFLARAKRFKPKDSELDMDRGSATTRLRRLRDLELPAASVSALYLSKHPGDKDGAAKAAEAANQQRRAEIHRLEDLLGIARTDFDKPRLTGEKREVASRARFNEIEFEKIDPSADRAHVRRTSDERIALIEKETDVGTLHLVMSSDEDPEVVAAAEKRLGLVELDAEVRAAAVQRVNPQELRA